MEPLELLIETVVDTLKRFSKHKRYVTRADFRQALSARQELLSLLDSAQKAPTNRDDQEIFELREAFLKILDNLAPMIKGDLENQFSEIQKKTIECASLQPLSTVGQQIGQMIGMLIDNAIGRMDYSNNFLFELSKDLYKMEQQLSSYYDYNKETHQISAAFNNDLSSRTYEMNKVFDSGMDSSDIQQLITSKLNIISKAIEAKRKTDEGRLLEADSQIAELQNDLRNTKQEILKVRERSQSLEKEVLLDELTQLKNRRAYDLDIKETLRHYRKGGERFSLLLADIDHFKNINDLYGHKAGDKCLREIAKLIKSSLRQTDFLARYGGEEFVAILYGSNAGNAQIVAEKVRRRIEQAVFSYQDEPIPVTISLGVTEVMPSDVVPESPFVRVDEALYRAKNDGRNRVCVNPA